MKTYAAEVLGTFLLVFLGTASIVIGGLGLSTPVTLLVVPGLYAGLKRWKRG